MVENGETPPLGKGVITSTFLYCFFLFLFLFFFFFDVTLPSPSPPGSSQFGASLRLFGLRVPPKCGTAVEPAPSADVSGAQIGWRGARSWCGWLLGVAGAPLLVH